MTPKERIFAVLNHQEPDRMPCFGANSTATYDQMERVNAFWPQAHKKAEDMARLALAAHSVLGLDAVRVPFCQTFEAEALGCTLMEGGTEGIPGIQHPPTPYGLDDLPEFPKDFLLRGRIPELIKAVGLLKQELGHEIPVIGGIIGPLSIAASLLDMVPTMKATRKSPEKLKPFLEIGEKAGTTLAIALVEAGADIIVCEDMISSPEMIAPKTYQDYELFYQSRQFQAISVPKILHICGRIELIAHLMAQTGADILSIEPKADLNLVRDKCGPDIILMGGVGTSDTLFLKDPQTVEMESLKAMEGGIQILAPGCTISPGSPTENIRKMVETASNKTRGENKHAE
jgi:[methyl-Co(III) methanol-specific corrinoid protein]:coenzyme M methyltransferase